MKSFAGTGAESPTTARPLDFDDETQESGIVGFERGPGSHLNSAIDPVNRGDIAPPPQPPRPVNPKEQAEATLKEAFPTIDAAVVRAVLTASGGRIEPAFNALLGMSDPDSQQQNQQEETIPPPQPPRPRQEALGPSTPLTQLESDELYARQLAQHYNNAPVQAEARSGNRPREDPYSPPKRRQTGLKPNEMYDKEHSFIDDDLPLIKENIRKGFLETQSKVNKWVAEFKKKIDGDDEEEDGGYRRTASQGFEPGPSKQSSGPRRSGEYARRSGDRERYDADPRVLGDDFTALDLRDDGAPVRRSSRPLANPDLFKQTPDTPRTASKNRKVSFQDGPPEDIDSPYRRPSPKVEPVSTGKQSKWQPLSMVDPSPIADHDPFSLGDSEDERELKSKDSKPDELENPTKATVEALPTSAAKPNQKDSAEEGKIAGIS
ncbi:MAG: ubiquitin-binding protein cue5 [Trizodia sp. TS-e1964]|nr:MAG: ubiquitin-binding protein cue5 [Trizodia sp. TS-e1964]